MSTKPLKLYTVTLQYEAVVAAHDSEDAKKQAIDDRYDITTENHDPDVDVAKLEDLKRLPDQWTEDAIPYGRAHADQQHTIKLINKKESQT